MKQSRLFSCRVVIFQIIVMFLLSDCLGMVTKMDSSFSLIDKKKVRAPLGAIDTFKDNKKDIKVEKRCQLLGLGDISKNLLSALQARPDFYLLGPALITLVREDRKVPQRKLNEEYLEFLLSLEPANTILLADKEALYHLLNGDTVSKKQKAYLDTILHAAQINLALTKAFHTWIHDNLLFISKKDETMRKRLGFQEKKKFNLGQKFYVCFQGALNHGNKERPFKPIITSNIDLPAMELMSWLNKFYAGTGQSEQSERVKQLNNKYIFSCRNEKNSFSCRICNQIAKTLALKNRAIGANNA